VQVCTFKDMDEATVKLVNQEFVPLAHNGWGFGEILTARGEVIAPRLRSGDTGGPNGANNPFAPRRLQAALEKFRQLPPEKRKASLEDLPRSWKGKAFPSPPAGGIILKQYRRALHRDAEGVMHRQSLLHDFLWLTQAEWQSLVPEHPRVGDSVAAPPFLVSRIGSHHVQILTAAGALKINATPKSALRLTVEGVSPEQLRLRLEGSLHVTESQSHVVTRGVIAYRVDGCLEYDRKKQAFTRFDLAALGEITNYQHDNAPPRGRTLLGGMVFELSPGDSPWERTVPGCSVSMKEYFKTGK